MRDIDEEILDFLREEPGEQFTSQEVTDEIESDYNKGYVHRRLNHLLDTRTNLDEGWRGDTTFGYWFGDSFIPANRSALEDVLRHRVDEDVEDLILSHLRDLAEEHANNAASLNYQEKLFSYTG